MLEHASITESVDSVCRDGTDMPYVAIQTEAWKTAKTAVVRLCGYLTFILECSVTTKTVKVASNHRGSTKPEFVKTAKLFIFFLFQTGYLDTAVSTHCSFSANQQHFLARRSTISHNLHNFQRISPSKQGTFAAAFQLDAIFKFYTHATTW